MPRSLHCSLFLAVSVFLAFSLPALADDPPGKALFVEHKCNKCHSIDSFEIERTATSDKMKGPDLSHAGDQVKADWVVRFVTKEVKRDDKSHMGKFDGNKKELQTIADWVASLKAP